MIAVLTLRNGWQNQLNKIIARQTNSSSHDSRMRVRSPGCFMVNTGPALVAASLTSVDKRWRAAPGVLCTVYCVTPRTVQCTVPGPARAVRHLQRGVLSARVTSQRVTCAVT